MVDSENKHIKETGQGYPSCHGHGLPFVDIRLKVAP